MQVPGHVLVAGSIGPYGACLGDGSEYTGAYLQVGFTIIHSWFLGFKFLRHKTSKYHDASTYYPVKGDDKGRPGGMAPTSNGGAHRRQSQSPCLGDDAWKHRGTFGCCRHFVPILRRLYLI